MEAPVKNLLDKVVSGIGVMASMMAVLFVFAGFTYAPYHAFKKHGVGDGWLSIILPAYGWYMAVEGLFWHDDFAGIDWVERTREDVNIIASLLGSAADPNPKIRLDHSETAALMKKRIASYPTDRRTVLETFASDFVALNEAMGREMIRSTKDAAVGTRPTSWKSNEVSIVSEKIRRVPGGAELMQEMDASMELMIATTTIDTSQSLALPGVSGRLAIEQSLVTKALDVKLANWSQEMRRVYTALFGG